jgi:hypothetical protein
MYRIILLIALLPIAAALAARWWFGTRVLAEDGGHPCRSDLSNWLPAPGDESIVHRAEESADEFGRQLRLKALADWRAQDPKAAASREGARRFGLAVPPLSGVIAIFALVVGKVPVMGALAIFLAATALAALIGMLTLPPELAAIHRAAKKTRETRCFPDRDDEDAVIRCAAAHAWDAALPPILRLIGKSGS